jgi:hypothetical protein
VQVSRLWHNNLLCTCQTPQSPTLVPHGQKSMPAHARPNQGSVEKKKSHPCLHQVQPCHTLR